MVGQGRDGGGERLRRGDDPCRVLGHGGELGGTGEAVGGELDFDVRLARVAVVVLEARVAVTVVGERSGLGVFALGEGEAEADRIRSSAQKADPEFYSFLRKLEEYQKILGDNRTTLLLSTHRELFDALFAPPRTAPLPVPKP